LEHKLKKLNLATAVGHIKQICDDNRAGGHRLPFFLLTGAGLSFPPVPLASMVEEHCKTVAVAQNRKIPPKSKRTIDTYSYWFDLAYPQPVQRQRYLRGLMQAKPISQASFRLAHLLSEKSVASLVVTTNFDDFLSRALNLFGVPHIVCDHPRTVERIDTESEDIQIIHVHGTYWFYDCCNLTGEIEERSRSSAETSLTMASLLDTVLSGRTPLVMGYAGWEGDVVMCALKRRLHNRLPYNLYWFLYRESELASLPEWLKDHPDVCFVVDGPLAPQEPDSAQTGSLPENEEESSADPEPTISSNLSAQKVLDELIRTFNIAAPPLTSDPLGHFANYLKGSLPQDDGQSAEADIYFMSSVVEYIEGARKRATVKRGETRMEKIRDLMRRSHFREAIRLGAATAADRLSAGLARDLLRTMLTAAFRLDDGSTEEIKGYDLVINLADSLTKQDTFVKERVAMALVNKGLALSAANRHTDAIIAYDDAVKRLTRRNDLFFRAQTAEAIFNKGFSLSALGEHRQAIQVYGHLVKRLGHPATPELQEMVAMALLNQGYAFGEINQSQKELRAYEDVLRRYGRSPDPDVSVHVAEALYNKGVTLERLNRHPGAQATFRDLIARLEGTRSRELRELADNARLNLDGEDPDAGGTRTE
jgi:hypothetical protein